MDHKNKQIKRFLSQKGNGGLTKSNGFSASGLVTEPSRGTFLSGGVLSELFSTLIYHRTLSGRNISGGKYLTEHSVVKANLSFLCSIKCSLPNPLKLNFCPAPQDCPDHATSERPWPEPPSKLLPGSWPLELHEILSAYYFKLLNVGIICYTAIGN